MDTSSETERNKRRFLLESNLNTLRSRAPDQAARLQNCESSPAVEFVPAGDRETSIRYRGVLLHSRHNPRREAERIIASSITGSEACCVLGGLGMGFLLEALDTLYPRMPVIIFEADPSLARAVFEHRDLRHLIGRRDVDLVVGGPPETVIECLKPYRHGPFAYHILRGAFTADEQNYREFGQLLEHHRNREQINDNTLKRFGRRWIWNLMQNLPLLVRSGNVDELKNRFEGFPVLLAAAGPTLDEIRVHLPEIRKRALIISVDTALPFFSELGIQPDILLVVDPQYWNTRHLDWSKPLDPIMVSESSTHPRVFRKHPTGCTLLCGSLFPLGVFLEDRIGEFGLLGAGGSVATSGWDLARISGASPIYTAGLDLGFPDGRTHFRGSFYHRLWLSSATRLSSMENAGYNAMLDADIKRCSSYDGKPVKTDRRLDLYRWWFADQRKIHPETQVYSLSSRASAIEGFQFSPVETLLEQPQKRKEIDAILDSVRNSCRPENDQKSPETRSIENRDTRRRRLVSALQDLERELAELKDNAEEGAELAAKLNELIETKGAHQVAVQQTLEKLDTIDHKILNAHAGEIAGFLVRSEIKEILGGLGEDNGGARTSMALYQQLAGAARFYLERLEQAHRIHIDLFENP
ncbi:MAG: DUF115 domain-containing protein [Spirochaetales bacterium]|nr:DUF115 domain-containing protein [Spirochaetales bacterium]MCF7939141.1 DUF115 domain-containing protein [Spirochaetales bacterium]